jgi:hypothetical protein
MADATDAPTEFPSYDDVDSDEGQAELGEDNFDESAVTNEELTEGCCK